MFIMNRLTAAVSGMISRVTGNSPETAIGRDFVTVRCIDEDKIAPAIYEVPHLNRALRRELGFTSAEALQSEYRHTDPEVFSELVDAAHSRLAGRAALYGAAPRELKI